MLFNFKKQNKKHPVICNNIDEPGRPCAKWNTPDTHKYLSYI
jgi:hypothetical protein